MVAEEMPTRLRTLSGPWLDLDNPDLDQLCIFDIAHGLSNTCRFAGQCRSFYSVAEHCCHLHDQLHSWGFPAKDCMAALLHDAAEAYLHDVSSPLKRKLPEYKALERRVQDLINTRYGVVMPGVLKKYDVELFKREFSSLYTVTEVDVRWVGPLRTLADRKLRCWFPPRAKREFLYRFHKWTKGVSWNGQSWWRWCADSLLFAAGF